MTKYRIDKTFGKSHSFQEADNNREYWLQRSVEERLTAAWYMICQTYGIDSEKPPRLDKTVFRMGKNQNS